MTPEERLLLDELKGGRAGARDSKERKAGRSGIAVECPCCRYWFQVGDREVWKHMLRKSHDSPVDLAHLGAKPLRAWFEAVWGLRLAPKSNDAGNLVTRFLGRIFQSGFSRGMNSIFQLARLREQRPPLIVAWNPFGDNVGENYVCFPMGRFFEVFTALCSDGPEFHRRAEIALLASSKGAASRSPVGVGDGQEDLGPVMDEATAFVV